MISDWFDTATQWLEDVSSNWWFLIVIFVIALLDSVIPIVPSETTVIIGGVAAGQGEQWLPLVILAGASGAFVGDNLAYEIGHRFKGRIQRWAERREKRREQLDGYGRGIKRRGGSLLITARFIPGGRTLLTISCGLTDQPRGWFMRWVAIAVTIWACYAGILGYVFGQAFQDNHTLAFFLAFATALSVSVVLEIVRWVRERRKRAAAVA